MTKRDTIIVTALINAGLLVILFVSALKQEERKEEVAFRPELKLNTSDVVVRSEAKKIMGDEVDQVLKQYTQQDPLQKPAVREFSAQVATPAPVSFVDDLKSVTEPVQTETPSFLTTEAPLRKTNIESESVKAPIEIVVKKGDVLEKLARQHHTSVSEIMKINHLASTQLKIGQILKIPFSGVKVTTENKQVEKKPLDPTSAKYYIVKSGDNLWTIAVKNHIKVEELLKINNLNEEKARKLKPGDRIRIQ